MKIMRFESEVLWLNDIHMYLLRIRYLYVDFFGKNFFRIFLNRRKKFQTSFKLVFRLKKIYSLYFGVGFKDSSTCYQFGGEIIFVSMISLAIRNFVQIFFSSV